jgi:chorismate-pyruvate lyase
MNGTNRNAPGPEGGLNAAPPSFVGSSGGRASRGPQVTELFAQFPAASDQPTYEPLLAEELPAPFRKLLAHEHHMTVTVEDHWHEQVNVRILASRLDGSSYTRKIILTTRQSGRVVLFGIVRINLDYCAPPVRTAILAGDVPLGRILIQHNVLRRIEPTAYFRIDAGAKQLAWFGLQAPQPLFGRLGFIYCDHKPAVELLEIVPNE